MALPPSGRKFQELLVVATEDFELIIKGPPKNKVVEAFALHQDERGEPMLAGLRISPGYSWAKVYDPSAPSEISEYTGGSVFPCFFEQTNYEVVIEKKEGCVKELRIEHLNKQLREAVTPAGMQGRLITGIINFQGEVGFSCFEILGDGKSLLSIELEVFPSKLDYQRDFWLLLQEVNEEVYNLAYDFLMRTSFFASLKSAKEPSPAEFFYIFNAIYTKFFKALERLKERPHHQIVSVNRVTTPARVKRANHTGVSWLVKKSYLFEADQGCLVEVGGSAFTPRKALDCKKELNFDTYENRFLIWMLKQVDRKLKAFEARYKDIGEKTGDKRVTQFVTEKRRQLQRNFDYSFFQYVGELKQVEHTSLVMQMAPGYRDVYRCYLMLIKGLNISSDLFSLSLKDMAELYEYWCFLKINSLLRKKYHLERNGLISVDRKGITVSLKKGQESQITYRNPINNETFGVTYNRSFVNLPTVTQIPDNILKLEKGGSQVDYLYIFDAKYRISTEEDYIRAFGQAGPAEDTINAMHRYRDAIINNKDKNGYRRDVFGAFVLFPHNNEMAFAGRNGKTSCKFYESISQVGIGALPFLPGQTTLVEELLDALLMETPESAFERTILQDGTGEYLEGDGKRNVLIGPLGTREQLNVCLEKNMYYTYLEMVQSCLGELEYVAIYQSKQKFKDEEQQGIFHFGRIKSFQILRRKDIREVASGRRPEQLAVKFLVEKWQRRLEPIKPGGFGPAEPQRTSWRLFDEAKIYPELHLSALEVRLWRELRRLQDCLTVEFPHEMIKEADRMQYMEFPGLVVEGQEGNSFCIKVGGYSKLFFFDSLNQRPGKVLREIISFWREYGLKDQINQSYMQRELV
jgi:predicted component of viral defense system (DUF524 family)